MKKKAKELAINLAIGVAVGYMFIASIGGFNEAIESWIR